MVKAAPVTILLSLMIAASHADYINSHLFAYESQEIIPSLQLKSERDAVYWSLSAIFVPSGVGAVIAANQHPAVGITMIVSSVFIGPSVGHFYAGQWGRGFKTIGIRLGIGAAGILTTASLFSALDVSTDPADIDKFLISTLPLGLAASLIIVQGIYDISATRKSVRKYNERLNLQLQPEINLQEKRFGVGLLYRF